jgi:hypothetical protein
MLNESGAGYYIVQTAATAAPSVAVLLATSPVAIAGSTPKFVPLTGLLTGTAYVVYFIAKDTVGNTQTTVSSVAFTTP